MRLPTAVAVLLAARTGGGGGAAAADVTACGWSAASQFCHGPTSGFEHGIGYPHTATTQGPTTTSEVECCCACANEALCNGWTLNSGDGKCFLKQNAGPGTAVKSASAVSGLMPARPPPPPYHPLYPTPVGARSILFLAVDDMRPSLGAYNFTLPGHPSHSPNIDKLAREGTLFTHAYVQYAYCSPSRNSFMTGRRPDTTKVWEFADHFREVGVGKNWVSMPQYFKQFGFLSLGGGKLYHPSSSGENIGMPFMDWPESWSPEFPSGEPAPYFFPSDNVHVLTCAAQGPVALPPGSFPSGLNGTEKFTWCALEVDKDDNKTFGQQVRDNCVERLQISASSKKPFFLGCGFHKPHAPCESHPPPHQLHTHQHTSRAYTADST